MTVSDHIHRLLAQLLEERQVVVWYADDGALRELAARFHAPNRRVVDASDSVLQARREADRIFRGLNDPDDPELRNANLLIYCPRQRAKQDDERCQDPFEVFAVCGAAFGDKPNVFSVLTRIPKERKCDETNVKTPPSRCTVFFPRHNEVAALCYPM